MPPKPKKEGSTAPSASLLALKSVADNGNAALGDRITAIEKLLSLPGGSKLIWRVDEVYGYESTYTNLLDILRRQLEQTAAPKPLAAKPASVAPVDTPAEPARLWQPDPEPIRETIQNMWSSEEQQRLRAIQSRRDPIASAVQPWGDDIL